MLVSALSEAAALTVVAVEVPGVGCAMVLGVFRAWVTKNLALWTDLLEPCIQLYKLSLR